MHWDSYFSGIVGYLSGSEKGHLKNNFTLSCQIHPN